MGRPLRPAAAVAAGAASGLDVVVAPLEPQGAADPVPGALGIDVVLAVLVAMPGAGLVLAAEEEGAGGAGFPPAPTTLHPGAGVEAAEAAALEAARSRWARRFCGAAVTESANAFAALRC